MTETTYETLSYSEQYYRAKIVHQERVDFFFLILGVCVSAAVIIVLVGHACTALYDRLKNKR